MAAGRLLTWYDSADRNDRRRSVMLELSTPTGQRGTLYFNERDTPGDVWPAAQKIGTGYSVRSAELYAATHWCTYVDRELDRDPLANLAELTRRHGAAAADVQLDRAGRVIPDDDRGAAYHAGVAAGRAGFDAYADGMSVEDVERVRDEREPKSIATRGWFSEGYDDGWEARAGEEQ